MKPHIGCGVVCTVIKVYNRSGKRIYNRHMVFDTNRLRLIIYIPLLAN